MSRTAVRPLVVVGALIGGVLGSTPAAQAATITPTVFTDDNTANGNCTLREAVRAANLNSAVDQCAPGTGDDTITLAPGTYALSVGPAGEDVAGGGDLDILDNLEILGSGAGSTVIDGGGIDRVLHSQVPAIVMISDLTITGGNGVGTEDGGGILNETTLTLTRVNITGNEAGNDGGGIENAFSSANLTITDSALTNNLAPGNGDGGGLESYTGTPSLTLVNVTISGNRADYGGGFNGGSGPSTFNNVTITANLGEADNSGGAPGGGAYLAGPEILRNTIIAGNSVGASGVHPDVSCGGDPTSGGHNLIGDLGNCTTFTGPGDVTGQDPKLGPFADNGGPTRTHALLAGSPAIDAGGTDCAAADQRGVPRSACDIGAYELVTCFKRPVTDVGTDGDDVMGGTSTPEVFLSLGGKDTVNGKGGGDRICGGKGKDTLRGGAGKDRLAGEQGRDVCIGGGGRDKVRSCENEKSVP